MDDPAIATLHPIMCFTLGIVYVPSVHQFGFDFVLFFGGKLNQSNEHKNEIDRERERNRPAAWSL